MGTTTTTPSISTSTTSVSISRTAPTTGVTTTGVTTTGPGPVVSTSTPATCTYTPSTSTSYSRTTTTTTTPSISTSTTITTTTTPSVSISTSIRPTTSTVTSTSSITVCPACIHNGKYYQIGDKWTDDKKCSNYSCVAVDNPCVKSTLSAQIEVSKPMCPPCPKGYKTQVNKDKCCPDCIPTEDVDDVCTVKTYGTQTLEQDWEWTHLYPNAIAVNQQM